MLSFYISAIARFITYQTLSNFKLCLSSNKNFTNLKKQEQLPRNHDQQVFRNENKCLVQTFKKYKQSDDYHYTTMKP